MREKFYMLHVLDGGRPNTVYTDFEGAVARAKHLAETTRKPVMILTTTHEVNANVPPCLDTDFTVEELT